VADIFLPTQFTLDLQIDNAVDLYGTEIGCTYDATDISRQAVTWPQFFDANGYHPIILSAGSITLAAAHKHPAPALNGSGKAGELTFAPLTAGVTTVSCDWAFFNKEGEQIANGTATATLTLLNPGTLSGSFVHQLRSPHDGIAVTVFDAASRSEKAATTTGSGGGFTFNNLIADTYIVQGRRIGHLDYCHNDVVVVAGQTLVLDPNPTKLRAGDTDADRDVDLDDALAVATVFATDTTDFSIDFNGNGKIDGGDLTALGGNFNTTSNCN
jgi:hypothetical protein